MSATISRKPKTDETENGFAALGSPGSTPKGINAEQVITYAVVPADAGAGAADDAWDAPDGISHAVSPTTPTYATAAVRNKKPNDPEPVLTKLTKKEKQRPSPTAAEAKPKKEESMLPTKIDGIELHDEPAALPVRIVRRGPRAPTDFGDIFAREMPLTRNGIVEALKLCRPVDCTFTHVLEQALCATPTKVKLPGLIKGWNANDSEAADKFAIPFGLHLENGDVPHYCPEGTHTAITFETFFDPIARCWIHKASDLRKDLWTRRFILCIGTTEDGQPFYILLLRDLAYGLPDSVDFVPGRKLNKEQTRPYGTWFSFEPTEEAEKQYIAAGGAYITSYRHALETEEEAYKKQNYVGCIPWSKMCAGIKAAEKNGMIPIGMFWLAIAQTILEYTASTEPAVRDTHPKHGDMAAFRRFSSWHIALRDYLNKQRKDPEEEDFEEKNRSGRRWSKH